MVGITANLYKLVDGFLFAYVPIDIRHIMHHYFGKGCRPTA